MESVLRHDDKWHARLVKSGYFVGAVLLHLILFLLVATLVVFRPPVREETGTFVQVAVRPPPPPPPAPPAASGGDSMSNLEPTLQTVPPPSAPSVVTTTANSAFTVKSVNIAIPNLPAAISTPSGSGLSGQDAPGSSSGAGSSPFGSDVATAGAAQFQGFLYDLKQTADRKPTAMIPGNYHRTLAKFIDANWDPAILNQYYKSPTALNTSSIFIPTLSAMDGPTAFHVEKEVQPNMYVIWYKAKAAPSQDGTYHFVGVADDILLVRVDGRTVLDGSLYPVATGIQAQQKSYPLVNFRQSCPPDGKLRVGLPFQARAGEPVDIDVLIGEEPGGYSNYFLYMQRDESTYTAQSNGTPLLPVFQLDSNPIHPQSKPLSFPPASGNLEPWGAGK